MNPIKLRTLAIGTATLVAASIPASAVSFNFYQLDKDAVADDFNPTSTYWVEGGDNVSSNIITGDYSGSMVYQNGGISATATGTSNGATAAVVQDSVSNWSNTNAAGLGVYQDRTANNVHRGDDNITLGEVLTINFDRTVKITEIWITDDGHKPFVDDGQRVFSFNASELLIGNGHLYPGTIGTSFTFGYGVGGVAIPGTQLETKGAQYYLTSLTVESVPDSGATLSLLALGLLSLAAIRRKVASK